MFSKKSILSLIIFCLCFGCTPSLQAIEITPKTKMIGGGTLALVGVISTWYCYSKTKACDEKIKQLANEIDEDDFDEKSFQELKNKRWWYNLFTWVSGGTAITGVGVALWGWYHRYDDWIPGQAVDLIPGLATFTPHENGGYTLQGPNGMTLVLSAQTIEAEARKISNLDPLKLDLLINYVSSQQSPLQCLASSALITSPENTLKQRILKHIGPQSVLTHIALQSKDALEKARDNRSLNRKDNFLLGVLSIVAKRGGSW